MKYHRSFDLTWEIAGDRAVILDARGSMLTTLNPIGTLIWRFLDEPRRASDVTDLLAAHFPVVERAQLEADTGDFLDELLDGGLIVPAATG